MEFEGVPYRVSYRRIKYPRLEFKTGELIAILPHGSNVNPILEKHRDWIKKKHKFIRQIFARGNELRLFERSEDEFRKLVHFYADEASKKMKVSYSKIFFRTMRTKWASMSSRRNITANRLMRRLPEKLIEYIIYHEVAHLLVKRHKKEFWSVIKKYFDDPQAFERELFKYWFATQKKLGT